MTEQDFEPFATEVKRLAVVMRLRAAPLEVHQITKAYFAALRRYPIGLVSAGADRWIEYGDRFPKAKQWLDAIPAPSTTTILELLADDRDDWLAAERRGWEQWPCGCVLCLAAGVNDRPLRFVPDSEPDGRDSRARIGDRLVTRGHWAHGEELTRWYDARQRYLDALPPLWRGVRPFPAAEPPTRRDRSPKPAPRGHTLSFRERLEEIFRPAQPKPKPIPVTPLRPAPQREPGQEG